LRFWEIAAGLKGAIGPKSNSQVFRSSLISAGIGSSIESEKFSMYDNANALARGDREPVDYVNALVELKKGDGTIGFVALNRLAATYRKYASA
jgi:hypothetical protein